MRPLAMDLGAARRRLWRKGWGAARKGKLWLVWAAVTVSSAGALAAGFTGDDRRYFLPGKTTDGHYQIELACDECHSEAFSDAQAIQRACVRCHGAELAEAEDDHPLSKFLDPRNAERVAELDARLCVTCHGEHRPEITGAMGLTLPADYCYRCHQDIRDERPSHVDVGFDSCAASGCHNFHDNRALYEDYLLKHAGEPWLLPAATGTDVRASTSEGTPLLSSGGNALPLDPSTLAVSARDAVDPRRPELEAPLRAPEEVVLEWQASAHARASVNCVDCHRAEGTWSEVVSASVCERCHGEQKGGFEGGRHGMRGAVGLSPMTPGMARKAMKPSAHARSVDCHSCHAPHAYEPRHAALEACRGCHDDAHTRAYFASPHYLRTLEPSWPGPAVTCATCHLPTSQHSGRPSITQHNQNDNLRPSDKMARSVCQACHGLRFALDALADRQLVTRNFRGRPTAHVPSIDWALARSSH